MNIVYFDLETKFSVTEVGGWGQVQKMGMSVGVIYSSASQKYQIYTEEEVHDLIKVLRSAELVVGYNIIAFDLEVLRGYDVFFYPDQVKVLDLMIELQKKGAPRISLEALAEATLKVHKTADGMQALRWYREGEILKVAEYCCYDVKLTRLLHEYGRRHKKLFYKDRTGQRIPIPVEW